jgi:PAS domain S-box-containing protein
MTNETTFEITAASPDSSRALLFQIGKSFSGWTVILMTALTAAFIFYQVFEWGDKERVSLLADAMQAVVSVTAAFFAWRVTRHPLIDEGSRRAWRILTASFLLYAFGHTLWFYYSSILGIEPFPSLADAGFWLFYPLMLWALLSFPTIQHSASERLKFVIDVLLVLLGGTTAVWNFIIRPTIETSAEGDWLMTGLNLSYVVGDLVLLLGIATVLLRIPLKVNKIALLTIVFGLLNIAVADIGFAFFTLQGTYTSGHWIDNFFITGLLLFLVAGYFQYQNLSQNAAAEDEKEAEIVTQKFTWLPYLAVVLGCGMLLYEAKPYWSEPLGLVVFASLGMTALVVFRQITAVKENVRLLAEQTARQSEMRFRALVEHSSDMIAILNLSGVFTYQSPSFKNILGYENDELIGRNSLEFARLEDLQNIKNDFKSMVADPQSILVREYNFKHKNGSWLVLESITKTINDDENNMSGILFNLRDVTERRETENKLRAFTVKLERSNRELQDFAYVASHDLQEPLRKVQAFGDRLDRKCAAELSDEGKDYINRMRNAASRMQNLINDLLTFSRVSTKTQPFKPTDLSKIAGEVVSDLEVRIEQTGGLVEIADLPTIDADPLQIRQLLQNLIGNALKFHRADVPPIVKVYAQTLSQTGASFLLEGEEIQTESGDDDLCRLVIEDNGIGFDEKYLDRIFTVFQRLHGRTEYEGSGIGLAVCRKIVERHGGQITASAKSGEGATFYINLPIKQEEINIHETTT